MSEDASITPIRPKATVETLKDILRRAEAGEISQAVIIFRGADGALEISAGADLGSDIASLIGGIELMKHTLFMQMGRTWAK